MALTTTASGLQYEDTTVGEGAEATKGNNVSVHYTGWLYNNGEQGAKFDSSRDRNDPFEFSLGAGMVIKGWDEGVQGMKIGGKRTLIIPAALGYGARGAGEGDQVFGHGRFLHLDVLGCGVQEVNLTQFFRSLQEMNLAPCLVASPRPFLCKESSGAVQLRAGACPPCMGSGFRSPTVPLRTSAWHSAESRRPRRARRSPGLPG